MWFDEWHPQNNPIPRLRIPGSIFAALPMDILKEDARKMNFAGNLHFDLVELINKIRPATFTAGIYMRGLLTLPSNLRVIPEMNAICELVCTLIATVAAVQHPVDFDEVIAEMPACMSNIPRHVYDITSFFNFCDHPDGPERSEKAIWTHLGLLKHHSTELNKCTLTYQIIVKTLRMMEASPEEQKARRELSELHNIILGCSGRHMRQALHIWRDEHGEANPRNWSFLLNCDRVDQSKLLTDFLRNLSDPHASNTNIEARPANGYDFTLKVAAGQDLCRAPNETDDDTESIESDSSSSETVDSEILQVIKPVHHSSAFRNRVDGQFLMQENHLDPRNAVRRLIPEKSPSSTTSNELEKQRLDRILPIETIGDYESATTPAQRTFKSRSDIEETEMESDVHVERMIPEGLLDSDSDSESCSSCSTIANEAYVP